MEIRKIVMIGIAVAGLIFLAQWKLAQMENKFDAMKTGFEQKLDKSFKTLSDSISVRSEVEVVVQPNMFDKMFNTAANKHYNEIKKLIPEAIKKEMKEHGTDGGTVIINKSSLVIQGDSAMFLNSDGIITKVAKVQPISEDSSLLIVVPQEIELTTVTAQPDKDNPSNVNVYVTAYNRTTGDSLKIEKSMSFVLPGSKKRWEVNYKPYIGMNYDLTNGSWLPKAGIDLLTYNSKKFRAQIAGVEIRQNLKNQNSFVDLKLIQMQFK